MCLSFFLYHSIYGVKGSKTEPWPVTIWDGYTRVSGKTTSGNPAEILAQNNIKVFPEDKISQELITDPVADGSVGQKVVIKRAPFFEIKVDGKTITVRSWNSSVEVLIKKGKITLHRPDILNPKRGSKLLPGETLIITRINEEDIKKIEDISFQTIYRGSTSVPFGETRILQEGRIGKVKRTYHVVYRNGIEISRWLKGTKVLTAKRDKIVESGVITGRANFGYYSGMVTSFFKGMTGHHLLVTNNENGKQVKVLIIGSGPFGGPLMDMGTEPFQAIGGSLRDGYIPSVSVQLLD